VRWQQLRSSQSLPGKNVGPRMPDYFLFFFLTRCQKSNFYVKSPDFEILAIYSNIFKTVWSKENLSAGYIQPTGCQLETSILDNILMDEDNSFYCTLSFILGIPHRYKLNSPFFSWN
jgi:hypothetical protein